MSGRRDSTIGVIGLGQIGGGVARAVVGAGRRVAAYDIDPAVYESFREVERVASPREVAQAARIVVVAVFDDEQVTDAVSGVDGLLAAVERPLVVCVLSTISVKTLRAEAVKARAADADLIDCGVTGGPRLADEGKIVVLAGGSREAVEQARPALDLFAEPLLHMGPLGAGMQAKLARNMMHFSAFHASWEAARVAAAAGIDIEKLVQAHEISNRYVAGTSLLSEGIGPGVRPAEGATTARRERVARFAKKDLDYLIELADELQIPVPGARLAREQMDAVVGLDESPLVRGDVVRP